MRILHLTPYYPPAYAFGGVVRAVEGMATALAASGHQVTVLTTDAMDQSARYLGPAQEELDSLQILRRPNLSKRLRGQFNLSTPRSMRQSALSILPTVDIAHAHEFRTIENLLVLPVARTLDIPVVLSPHGTLNRSTGRSRLKAAWDRLLSPTVAQGIDHVVALTAAELHEVKAIWARFGPRPLPTSFNVVPNGVKLQEFENLPPARDFRRRYGLGAAPTVLFLGRLQARKGVDLLVRAFQRAQVEHARLLIAGPDEGMLSQAQALANGDKRIVFTGYLGSAERMQALAAGDIFALPARGEGMSMAVLEALAAGLPAVITPGCNMPELEAAGAGFVAEATVDAVAVKLRQLLLDASLRARMGWSARQLVAERYTWDRVAVQLEGVYKQLLS